MLRIPTFLALLLAASALTWTPAPREGTQPGEAVPTTGMAVTLPHAPTVTPCAWSLGRRSSPWRSEQPFHLIEVERATEQEEESFDPILGPAVLFRSWLGLDDFDRETVSISSCPLLSQPGISLLPILRC